MIRLAAFLLLAAHAWAQPVAESVTQVGVMRHLAIAESSGLAASRRFPGVIWTHNDGGFQFLFAVNRSGKMLGAFQVAGNLIDWEDLATDAAGNLYLADTGSNGMARTHVAVHRVKEPNPYRRYGNATIERSWFLRFPAGPIQDCEAFFVHGGFVYLINKRAPRGTVNMYRFSLVDRRRSIPLQFVTKIPVESSVTAADLSPDNQRLALTSPDGVYLYFVDGRPASAGSARRLLFRFRNDSMEGGTFFGKGFLTSAETRQLFFFNYSAFQCREPARLRAPLTDVAVSAGTPVRFETSATGCPAPRFSWRFNGQLINGATNSFLNLPSVSAADAGVYQVIASNQYGSDTNSAVLHVRTKPDVRITEVLSNRATNNTVQTEDWWEMRNFDSVPIDLSGWRFNDKSGGLSDPFVIAPGLVIAPGETIVFVEELSAEEFHSWWGSSNLPANLRIVTYFGGQLSFSAAGDSLLLWDNLSTDPNDTVARADFGAADSGVSFIYDPTSDRFGAKSQLGVHGAVQAANSSDIGSPGRIAAAP